VRDLPDRADKSRLAPRGPPTTGSGAALMVRRSGVKGGLTAGRARRAVENDAYASFIRRVLRAHGRRVAAGDVEALGDLVALAEDIDRAVADAVAGLRQFGYSWADIAARLGVTRQAAQQRWGREGERPCR
jgi:hypothetical protein